MDIFILSGQSNMAGRGGVTNHEWDGVVPPECAHERGTILRLNGRMEWEEAHEPLHEGIDVGKVCGVGPGLVFAAEVRQRYMELASCPPPERIGLIPCARGGTTIHEWDREGPLYNAMVERTRAGLQGGATLRALLWYQGESDSSRPEQAEAYQRRMEALVSNLRTDLQHPDLPVIQVGVVTGDLPTTQFLPVLREAQRAVRLPGLFYVDAFGLTLQVDRLHLNTASQVQLGKQLAVKYLHDVVPRFSMMMS
eukprot:TRINITY_DN2479_c0_g1_i2.p1 TRINITY_DN2479_c0_g1~~TRINITY_DN2479_c0_g1_i2.p1  ORF type:complete len:252 (+),score=22.47 TRINITY_DN2479_c0_g1_i2:113-868(+)